MELFVDYTKFKRIIDSLPECKPILDVKTDGFKHLYENVFLPLNCGDNDTKLTVDVDSFDFNDLVGFNEFMATKTDDNMSNPVVALEKVISKLPPICKQTNFI